MKDWIKLLTKGGENYMDKTIYLDIKGMHCPHCPAKVEKSLSKMNAVSYVKVNYETEKGSVTFNSDVIRITEIINRIDKMGFEAKNRERVTWMKPLKKLFSFMKRNPFAHAKGFYFYSNWV